MFVLIKQLFNSIDVHLAKILGFLLKMLIKPAYSPLEKGVKALGGANNLLKQEEENHGKHFSTANRRPARGGPRRVGCRDDKPRRFPRRKPYPACRQGTDRPQGSRRNDGARHLRGIQRQCGCRQLLLRIERRAGTSGAAVGSGARQHRTQHTAQRSKTSLQPQPDTRARHIGGAIPPPRGKRAIHRRRASVPAHRESSARRS
jgi:hypothetical protein